jgi:hypothetical protein
MTGRKPKGNQERRRKTLQMKSSKERLCLVSALVGVMCPGIQAQWRSPILRFLRGTLSAFLRE